MITSPIQWKLTLRGQEALWLLVQGTICGNTGVTNGLKALGSGHTKHPAVPGTGFMHWGFSICHEIPECSLEGLMLKLQYFGHLIKVGEEPTHWKGPWYWEGLKGKEKRAADTRRCLNNIFKSMDMNLSKLSEIVKDKEVWLAAVHGVRKSWRGLNKWTITNV